MSRAIPHIAIVGAGFSGTLLAVHLLSRAESRFQVTLCERSPPFGMGLAYRTRSNSHVLNVPAARMSAFEDRPDHFLNWLASNLEDVQAVVARDKLAQSFVPRHQYGRYLQDLLDHHRGRSAAELHLRHAAVESIEREAGGFRLSLSDNDEGLECTDVVLALGHFAPDADRPPHYFGNPWHPAALRDLPGEAAVLVIGSGLTMIDMVSTLLDRGHEGPVLAVSRHGLLPRPHQFTQAGELPPLPEFDGRVRGLLHGLRGHCRRLDNGQWRAYVDLLRPHVQDVWQALPLAERARFLRHVRPWWDVHRHRVAPEVYERIVQAMEHGQLQVMAGRVENISDDAGGVAVTVRPRGLDERQVIRASRVLNCAGPRGYASVSDPLVSDLLARGLARTDPLGLGIDVNPSCEVLAEDGDVSDGLYAVGPVTRGVFWEITAVPEIRRQCEEMAKRLLARSQAAVGEASGSLS